MPAVYAHVVVCLCIHYTLHTHTHMCVNVLLSTEVRKYLLECINA